MFCLAITPFIGTPTAFSKRSAILQWFPAKLEQFHVLDDLPSNISHDVYMHCSYDTAGNKHNVKKALNQVIRSHLLKCGWQDKQITQSACVTATCDGGCPWSISTLLTLSIVLTPHP